MPQQPGETVGQLFALDEEALAQRLFIEQKLPAWLCEAPEQRRADYFSALHRQAEAIQAVRPVFARLQAPADFARTRLQAALEQRFAWQGDVASFELIRFEVLHSFPVTRRRSHRHTLVEAALANFAPDEALPQPHHGWLAPLGATRSNRATPEQAHLDVWRVEQKDVVPVSVDAFADCCRQLDLGQQYQQHLRAVLAIDDAPSTTAGVLREHCAARLRVAILEAWMKGDVSDQAGQMLLDLLSASDAMVTWGKAPAQLCWLEMLGSAFVPGHCLWGAFVVQRIADGRCIVCLPGDPSHPVKEYAGLGDFSTALGQRLGDTAYRRDFMGLISQRRRAECVQRLNNVLASVRLPEDAGPLLTVTALPIAQPLLSLLQAQAWIRVAEDARFHAVPTADCDRQARDERLARWRDEGVDVLNLLGLFIPTLGIAMGVYDGMTLMTEIFEGVDDWNHAQTRSAIDHVAAVSETLAVGAVLGRVVNAGFLDAFIPVATPGQPLRLWRDNLWQYRSAERLPATLKADEQGVLRHAGRSFVRIGGALHEIRRAGPGSADWQLQPPRHGAYAVPLEHNGQGAWRHRHENPLHWQGSELMSRWGPRTEGVSHLALNDLREISGVSEAELRRALFDHQPMPALLADVLDRYALYDPDLDTSAQSFALRYHQIEQRATWNTAIGAPLRRSFPALPSRVAERLVSMADHAEWLQLQTGKVPARLAEIARVQLREVRVARALEALYLGMVDQRDYPRLVLEMAVTLDQWPSGRGIELRADSPQGTLLHRLAPAAEGSVSVLVATPAGYLANDGAGLPSGPATDLLSAVQRLLGPADQALPAGHSTDALSRQLLDAALARRERLPEALGMTPLQRRFVRPQRLPDGRIGYPLSGRGVGRWRINPRLRQLFPAADDMDLRRIRHELRLNLFTADAVLRRLEADWQMLDASLTAWSRLAYDAPGLDAAEQAMARAMREEFVARMRSSWRREARNATLTLGTTGGYQLDLSGLAVDHLPILTVRFDHIGSLHMDRMHLRDDPSAFLQLFGQVRFVTLFDNQLAHVPEEIARLPSLVHLDLGRNPLQSSPHMFSVLRNHPALRTLMFDRCATAAPTAALADLPTLPMLEQLYLAHNELELSAEGWQHLAAIEMLGRLDLGFNRITLNAAGTQAMQSFGRLRELFLDHNPLRYPPNLMGMAQLQAVHLARTQIETWPPGLTLAMSRPLGRHVRRIDLSHNRIADLPPLRQTSFVAHRNMIFGRRGHRFSVVGNPLSPQSLDYLHEAGLETGSAESIDPSQPVAIRHTWLDECPAPLRDRLEQSRLEPETRFFYVALERVADTADYRVDPQGTRQRMRAIAEAILEPVTEAIPIGWSQLRQHIFLLAEDASQTCGDGVSLLLNQFETLIHLWRTASTETEGEVIAQSIRAFRLALVDDCAARIAQKRMDRHLALSADLPEAMLPALDPLDVIADEDLDMQADEAEIRLVLRRRLAAELQLPPQPEHMLYTEHVHASTLQRVKQWVIGRTTFEGFQGWLEDDIAWRFFLERTHASVLNEFEEQWGLASSFLDDAVSADGELPSLHGMAIEALPALQQAVPGVTWLDDQGRPQRVQVNSGQFNALYQALASAHDQARRALLNRLGAALLQAHCQLPHQVAV